MINNNLSVVDSDPANGVKSEQFKMQVLLALLRAGAATELCILAEQKPCVLPAVFSCRSQRSIEDFKARASYVSFYYCWEIASKGLNFRSIRSDTQSTMWRKLLKQHILGTIVSMKSQHLSR